MQQKITGDQMKTNETYIKKSIPNQSKPGILVPRAFPTRFWKEVGYKNGKNTEIL